MSRRNTFRASRRARVTTSAGAPSTTLLAYSLAGASLGNLGTLSSSFPGLNLSRASAATVQTSASTVDSTPTTDQARIGSQGAAWGRGLVIEESRRNDVKNSRDPTAAGWSAGSNVTTTAAAGTSPDGNSNACRHQVASNGFSRSSVFAESTGAVVVATEWLAGTAGTSPYQLYVNSGPAQNYYPGSATTTWRRLSSSALTVGVNDLIQFYPTDCLDNGGIGAADVLTDFHQVEIGQFATEAIVTAGAAVTRAGERLWISSAATIIDTNRMGLAFTFVGKGTPAQLSTGALVYLWWIDASNNCFIDTTQKLNVQLGGVTVTSASAIAWAFGDVVDIWVACGAGSNAVVEYRTNGGAKTVLLNTALAGNPSGASTIDILCSGTSNQLSCWLQNLTAYKTGQQPSWA